MYTDKHKEIVTSLMEGKFITVAELLFEVIKKSRRFYINFFFESLCLNHRKTKITII
jgi:hypothetical protein